VDTHLWSNEAIINLLIALLPILMACGSGCAIEKWIIESITYYDGAIEKHLMDSS